MTPPSLWKTIPFCLHLHGSSFFLLFCSQKTHGTFANIFKSWEKQDSFFLFFCCFFFFSLPPRRCFFLRRARQCQAHLGSSWMPRASGGERETETEREREREKEKDRERDRDRQTDRERERERERERQRENEVGEIFLISSCRFPFLNLTRFSFAASFTRSLHTF